MSIDNTKARQLAAQAGRGHLKSMRELLNLMLNEINPAQNIVPLAVTTSLNERAHGNKTIYMTGAGGARTFTLPAATGSGNKYRFVVGEVNTSNYVIKAFAGADVFRGMIIGRSATDSATDAARTWQAGSTDDTLTLNGTTQGGVNRGDWVEFEDVATDMWAVRGVVSQSGIEATPFSDSVA